VHALQNFYLLASVLMLNSRFGTCSGWLNSSIVTRFDILLTHFFGLQGLLLQKGAVKGIVYFVCKACRAKSGVKWVNNLMPFSVRVT
jgi:hypothetical protein